MVFPGIGPWATAGAICWPMRRRVMKSDCQVDFGFGLAGSNLLPEVIFWKRRVSSEKREVVTEI
jgi:hypothetical protein